MQRLLVEREQMKDHPKGAQHITNLQPGKVTQKPSTSGYHNVVGSQASSPLGFICWFSLTYNGNCKHDKFSLLHVCKIQPQSSKPHYPFKRDITSHVWGNMAVSFLRVF